MRVLVLAAVAALGTGAAANAQQPARQGDASAAAAKGGRVVFVCDRSETTRRSFEREHGQVSFVTADELVRAQAAGETWSAPRCITAAELQRWELKSEAAQVQQASTRR